jgi:predicted Zn-dependent peptidase
MSGPLPELADVSDLIGSTTVAGIPTLIAYHDGPMAAGLFFRVGHADETLATSGITHLVEHLALFGQNRGDTHHNGATGSEFTHFHVTGGEAEVVAFLNAVCASLTRLPIHRLETEKDILRTEGSRRGAGAAEYQAIERYGSVQRGVIVYDEVGLNAIDDAAVLEWARTRFTRQNAVLWIAGTRIPEGLVLGLPDGVRRPIATTRGMPLRKPAFFVGVPGGVLIDAVVNRSTENSFFSRVAAAALFRVLREEGGYSYQADSAYDPIDAERASVTWFADALPEQQAAAVGAMIDVLTSFRVGRVDERDLAKARDSLRLMLEQKSLGAAMLPGAAMDVLRGVAIPHPQEVVRRSFAIGPAELAASAREMWDDALAQVPEGSLEWAGFTQSPRWSQSTVFGARYPAHDDSTTALVIGDEGVALVTERGTTSVRFAECTGYLKRPDGARLIVGADGIRVAIEPTMIAVPAEAMIELDQRIPAQLVIPMPARRPEDIPQPSPTEKKKRWGLGR